MIKMNILFFIAVAVKQQVTAVEENNTKFSKPRYSNISPLLFKQMKYQVLYLL